MLIAIVDDDPIQHFIIKKIFQTVSKEQRLITFFNGNDALNFFTDNASDNEAIPDAIILDMHMPGIDGCEFLKQFENLRPLFSKDIKVYLSTASIGPPVPEDLKECVTSVLNKPITPAEALFIANSELLVKGREQLSA